jgi:hypothetical protein
LINYYSFSSFNVDDVRGDENAKKIMERLENQPMINALAGYFSTAL